MPSPWFSVVRDGKCSLCGLTASAVERGELGPAIVHEARQWGAMVRPLVDLAALRRRPRAGVWSALEYACHTRDTVALFRERTEQALVVEHPQFEYQDQDELVVEQRYNEQDPRQVCDDLLEAAERYADRLVGLSDDEWERTGTRLEDEVFDVALLARFALHEARHHRVDAESSVGLVSS